MECPICFHIISNSCHSTCNHRFCYNCLMKWCKNGGIHCPLCKQRMYKIILDKKFDMINNPKDINIINKEKTRKLIVDLSVNLEPEILVRKEKNDKEIGIIVEDLNEYNLLHNMLKVNDRILYLNGLPCVNIKNSMEIMNEAYINSELLVIELSLESANKKRSFLNLFRCFNLWVTH